MIYDISNQTLCDIKQNKMTKLVINMCIDFKHSCSKSALQLALRKSQLNDKLRWLFEHPILAAVITLDKLWLASRKVDSSNNVIPKKLGVQADHTSTSFHFPDFVTLTFVRVKVYLITWTPRVHFLATVSVLAFFYV